MSPSSLRALSPAQRRRLAALALGAAVAFVLVGGLVQLGVATEVEWRLQRAAQAVRSGGLETPMWAISLLGTGWVLLPASVAGAGALALCRHAALARWLILVSIGAATAANVAKLLVIRQRPNAVMWSYPSAHTFGIVVFMALLLYLLWALQSPPRVRAVALGAGVVLTVAVAVSRVYLNAHWISDVIGGAAGGLAFALVVVLLLDRRLPAPDAAAPTAPLGAVAG
jgi:membrane-associated phospholipid phosphatase